MDFAHPLRARRLATSRASKLSAKIPDVLVGASREKAPKPLCPNKELTRNKNNQVTIYGSNSGAAECSSDTLEFAEVGRCYNTSWEYYSIDNCIKPELLASSSTVLPSSTSTSASNESPPTSTIVGAVLGGIAGLSILVGALVYGFCFRRRRNHHVEQVGEPRELSPTSKTEMPADKDNERRFELSPGGLPSELGLHDPAEMEGDVRYPAEVGAS